MSHAPSAGISRRHQAVRGALRALDLEALVVTAPANITYLTNFTGSSAIVVVEPERIAFLTDFRYSTALEDMRGTPHECPGCHLILVDGSYDATLADVLKRGSARRVGFEANHLSVARYGWLQSRLPSIEGPATIELVPTERVVERVRVVKDDYEIATLREAASRLSRVAADVVRDLRRGQSERELAFSIDLRLRRAGFERPAFDTIAASGPNAALPHAHPTERTITEGDLVVLDFGGVYDSYCVDLTRTVSVGKADARVREVYAAVRDAHAQGIAAVGPGRSRFDIDAAARGVLAARGLGDAFGHGTGHGLGIEVHEEPRITRRRPDVDASDEPVAPGMVFTIEPGAYLSGWGGVRIEDDVLVTGTGVEVLTHVATELIEL
jgi:Xaa-Pro aminopeptidase